MLQKNLEVIEELLEIIDINNTWIEQYIDLLQIDRRWVNELRCKDFDLEKNDLSYQSIVVCYIISKVLNQYFSILMCNK